NSSTHCSVDVRRVGVLPEFGGALFVTDRGERVCMNKSRWMVLLALVLAFASAPAFAQGNSSMSSLTGTVVDKDGGVVPGVTVTVKNDATGVSQTTTTNSAGVYSFPTMDPGTYTVSVTLSGFKKVDITGVRLLAGVPGNTGKTL